MTDDTLATQRTVGVGAPAATDLGADRVDATDVFPAEAAGVELGAVIGRYVVVGWLGAGAMGVVVEAHDPKLDRTVALKLLRGGGLHHEELQARLLREAQALARLEHPNVVAIHDVGAHDGQTFAAIERVDGTTLRTWVQESKRSWREVLETFLAAGDGLAAAHAAGIVHRDFKPDNVMVGKDGRVRVMDFGLARASGLQRPARRRIDADETPDVDAEGAPLTKAGALMGTPSYMSPEQLAGVDATPRSDQFAFAVSLFEAMYGRRPFEGKTVTALAAAHLDAPARPSNAEVPGWLWPPLLKALAVMPRDRHDSMSGMLSVLRSGEAQRRRRRRRGVGAAVLLGCASLAGGVAWQRAQSSAACAERGDQVRARWGEDERGALRGAVTSSGVGYADEVLERVLPTLDQRAETLADVVTDACVRYEVEDTWDAERFDRASWCIEENVLRFDAFVRALRSGRRAALANAVGAAPRFEAVEACLDPSHLASIELPPPGASETRVHDVRRAIGDAAEASYAGDFERALDVATQARREAEALEWKPLSAAARLREALAYEGLSEFDQADETLRAAYFDAVEASSWAIAVRAAIQLVAVSGHQKARTREAELWNAHAIAAMHHLPAAAPLSDALRLEQLGAAYVTAQRIADAEAAYAEAVAIRARVVGEEHPSFADALANLANVKAAAGRHAEAVEDLERAQEIRVRELGPHHPRTADGLNNLGSHLFSMGLVARARDVWLRAAEVNRIAYPEDHPKLAYTLNNLATVLRESGQPEASADYMRQALELQVRVRGEEHIAVAKLRGNYGASLLMLGKVEEAEAQMRQSLEGLLSLLGPDDVALASVYERFASLAAVRGDVPSELEARREVYRLQSTAVGASDANEASAATNLARVLLRTDGAKGVDEAIELLLHAEALRERVLPPEHPHRAWSLTGLGLAYLATDRPSDAVAPLERARRIRIAAKEPAPLVAESSLALARALWAVPGQLRDRDRARALVAEHREAAQPADLAAVPAVILE